MTIQDFYECLKTNYYKNGYEVEYFWISGVLLVFVGSFGLFGNLMNLIILFQSNFRRETYYQLLIVLTIVDIYFIIFFGVQAIYTTMICWNGYSTLAVYDLTIRFVNVGRSLSIYTTVVISMERFLKVRYPFIYYKPRTWHYILFILTFSIPYNLPGFFEYKFFFTNGTFSDELRPYAQEYDYYFRYWIVADFLIMQLENIISMPIVLGLNLSIIITVWNSKRNVIKETNVTKRRNSVTKHSAELKKTILIFVSVFLLTRSLYICVHYLYYFNYENVKNWIYLEPIEGLLLMTNSSINIIVYVSVDSKFRRSSLSLIK